ncbi:MAG: GTP-binding protein [Thermoproteota archaeon]|jgi:GTP-binding protein
MSLILKNLAIVAHVDHGKTTLVDELLKSSGTYEAHEEQTERVMDSGELEKERGITITAKNCAINWKGTKINLLDTPGHADFGGEVERSLMMVDGVVLLVDAAEGPLPQTRFVLTKAIEQNLKIAVMINKVDRDDERIDEVQSEVEDLLLEIIDILGLEDYDLDLPFLYGSGRDGYCSDDKDAREGSMDPLLDFMIGDYFPAPKVEIEGGFQLLVTNLSYSNYLGQQMVGRITRGSIQNGKQFLWMGADEKVKSFKVSNLQIFTGLGQESVDEAQAGEICIIAGFEEGRIGDTISDTKIPEALPRIDIEPPTVSVRCSVSTSPLSGKEGEYLTSRKLEEFLSDSAKKNVSLQYEATEDPKVYILKARGELQVAVVFEQLRRAGYELMISRPTVLFKEGEHGEKLEPFEKVVLDIPADCTGPVTEKLAKRKGLMEAMVPLGDTRTRMEFIIPSRGLIGYRSRFLTDTRGEGLMSSQFLGYRPYAGDLLSRQNGALISDRAGKATPYALFNILSSGRQFISPGALVYEGMVIGECTKTNDMNLNCVREKHLAAMRTAGKDVNIILPPQVQMTLEFALDWIDDQEWVEVTPLHIRIRKKSLKQNERSVIRAPRKEK